MARLAADDDPIDPPEVQARERPQEWLKGQEAHGCRRFTHRVSPPGEAIEFDGGS
jgi:hypothetical protein